MAHQDWKQVIVSGKMHEKKQHVKKDITTLHINKQELCIKVKKIYDPDNPSAEPDIKPIIINKEFANKISSTRVARKLTQKQLAQSCGIPVSVIAQYEKACGIHNVQYINKIKKVLGFDLFK